MNTNAAVYFKSPSFSIGCPVYGVVFRNLETKEIAVRQFKPNEKVDDVYFNDSPMIRNDLKSEHEFVIVSDGYDPVEIFTTIEKALQSKGYERAAKKVEIINSWFCWFLYFLYSKQILK